MTLFLANITNNETSETNTTLYRDYDQFFKDTFAPIYSYEILPLKIKGKSYHERKNFLYDLAIEYSSFDCRGLSYYEMYIVTSFFENNAKRYGLLNEFRENCIC